jgi:hypothetical protein
MKLWMTSNYTTRKNAHIIHVCTKLHSFVIHMAYADGGEYGRVGAIQGDTVNLLLHGILPMKIDGPVN